MPVSHHGRSPSSAKVGRPPSSIGPGLRSQGRGKMQETVNSRRAVLERALVRMRPSQRRATPAADDLLGSGSQSRGSLAPPTIPTDDQTDAGRSSRARAGGISPRAGPWASMTTQRSSVSGRHPGRLPTRDCSRRARPHCMRRRAVAGTIRRRFQEGDQGSAASGGRRRRLRTTRPFPRCRQAPTSEPTASGVAFASGAAAAGVSPLRQWSRSVRQRSVLSSLGWVRLSTA